MIKSSTAKTLFGLGLIVEGMFLLINFPTQYKINWVVDVLMILNGICYLLED